MSRPPLDAAALISDQHSLARLVRGLAGDDQAVEDVLQETRLRAWRRPPLDPSRSGGWLRRIASNVALRMRSSEAARRMREEASARPERVVSTDELVGRVEMQRAVADAVLGLEEPYRAAILMRFFDDLPPREIAERLQVPVETVRTRIKRGLGRLRGRLDRRYGARDAWSAILASSAASKVLAAASAVLLLGIVTWRIVAGADPELVRPDTTIVGPTRAAEDRAELPLPDSRTSVPPAVRSALYDRVRVRGRVVDEGTGAPVAGASVKLRYRGPDQRHAELVALSQDDGAFTGLAEAVTHDSYFGEVAHPEYATTKLPVAALEARRVGDDLEADLGLVRIHRGTLVSGSVVGPPDRSPVAGAELFLLDPAVVAPNFFGPDSARPAGRSRADGSFELPRRVIADSAPLALLAVSDGRIGFALLRPARSEDRLADLEVVIEPQGSLSVRVVDDQGAPAAGVALTAYPTFPPFGCPDWTEENSPWPPEIAGEVWRAIFLAKTDGSGRARFPALPEGRKDSLFEHALGHTQAYRVHAVADGWPAIRMGVLIERGKEATLEIRLRPPSTTRVRGRVVEERGRPVANASVQVTGFDEARTDDDGRYATEGRPAPIGRLVIRVEAEGFSPAELREAERPRSEEVERDFVLVRSTSVRGRVVDSSGAPVPGVQVAASGLDRELQNWVHLEASGGRTGSDGRFVIEGVSVDFLSLEVEPPEGFLQPFPVRIVRGGPDLLVTLLPAPPATARAVATVRDAATGETLDPVMASGRPRSSMNFRWGRCAPGEVVLDGLAVGRWELFLTVNDGRRGRAEFEVTRPDETVRLDVAIQSPGIVEGELFANGAPLQPGDDEWWIWVRPSSNDAGDSGHAIDAEGRPVSGLTDGCAVADESGRFRIGRLPSGMPIRFVVEGKDRYAEATVVLRPGEKRRVEFHLEPAATVRWQQSESLPRGRLVIETARGDEPLARLLEAPTGVPGTTLATVPMSAGRVRWRAEFTSSVEFPPRVRVASGEIDLRSGETRIVDVVGFD